VLTQRHAGGVDAVETAPFVVEYSWPQDVVVGLATGGERERVHRTEYWFDQQRGKLRAGYSTDGSEPIEYVELGAMSQLDPALAGFVTQYRDALADERAHVIATQRWTGGPRSGSSSLRGAGEPSKW
jgi:hypothetical protein